MALLCVLAEDWSKQDDEVDEDGFEQNTRVALPCVFADDGSKESGDIDETDVELSPQEAPHFCSTSSFSLPAPIRRATTRVSLPSSMPAPFSLSSIPSSEPFSKRSYSSQCDGSSCSDGLSFGLFVLSC